MITEQYVGFLTAQLLKEKGFDVPTKTYYEDEESIEEYDLYSPKPINWNNTAFYAKPSQSLVMRWLREEKHFYIQIMLDSWALGGHSGYYIVIQDINSEFKEISPIIDDNPDLVFFETYEQAAESAIKYCLENLI